MDKTTKNLLGTIIGIGSTIASGIIIKKSLESMEMSDKEVIRYKNKQVRNNTPIKDIKPQAEFVAKVGSTHKPYNCDKDIDDLISIRRTELIKLQELVDNFNDMLESTVATKSNTRDGLIPLCTAYKLIVDMIDDMESQIYQSLIQAMEQNDDESDEEDYEYDEEDDGDDDNEFEFNWNPRLIGKSSYNKEFIEQEFALNKLYEDDSNDTDQLESVGNNYSPSYAIDNQKLMSIDNSPNSNVVTGTDECPSETLILDDQNVEQANDEIPDKNIATTLLSNKIEETKTDDESGEDDIGAYSAYHLAFVFPHDLSKRKFVKPFRKMEDVGEYTVLIDWGDGNKNIIKSSDISSITHDYENRGNKYAIKVVVTNTERSAEILDIFEEWVHKANTMTLSKEATEKIFNV